MIDFIVSFIGENSGVLAHVFFGTLGRHCDLSNVALHLVRKQVSDLVWLDVTEYAMRLNRPMRMYDLDTHWHPYANTVDSFSYQEFITADRGADDAAATAKWCVKNCGDAEWCVLSHFDIVWRADILKWLCGWQRAVSAQMVGSHCPVMLLNRMAYRDCGVGFGLQEGCDVGVALGRVLSAVPFPPDPGMEWCYHHMGGGGGYHRQEEFDSMRQRAVQLAGELEL